jgi:hypothetical protein
MTTPTIGELMALLEEQRARIERLEAHEAHDAAREVTVDESAGGSAAHEDAPTMTRRGMLTGAAVGTAGLVGALLAVDPGVAAAAGPGTFTSATSNPAVRATDTGTGSAVLATANGGASVRASQLSKAATAIAVQGTIDSTTPGAGTGVKGASPGGIGVKGGSTTGTGVLGVSSTGTGVVGSSGATTGDAAAIEGTITSTSPGASSAGVRGVNNGTGGDGVGVYGSQAGSGWGVYGTTAGDGIGVFGDGPSLGVQGTAQTGGTGVHGTTIDGNGVGVYGEADLGTGVQGVATSGTGVEGSSSTGTGVDGGSSSGYGVLGESTSNYGVIGVSATGNGVYGQVTTTPQAGVVGRTLDASGNWAIYGFGNIGATGTKSAVVPTEVAGEYVTLYCVESPECWFEDFGGATLVKGSVRVVLDPAFAQTVETERYHVFLQAEGECKGLCVVQKSPTGFMVRELDGGRSDVAFCYRVVALRRGVVAPRLNRVSLPASPAAVREERGSNAA